MKGLPVLIGSLVEVPVIFLDQVLLVVMMAVLLVLLVRVLADLASDDVF